MEENEKFPWKIKVDVENGHLISLEMVNLFLMTVSWKYGKFLEDNKKKQRWYFSAKIEMKNFRKHFRGNFVESNRFNKFSPTTENFQE